MKLRAYCDEDISFDNEAVSCYRYYKAEYASKAESSLKAKAHAMCDITQQMLDTIEISVNNQLFSELKHD